MTQLIRSAWLLPEPDRCLRGGGVLVEDGRIAELAEDERSLERLARRTGVELVDLGECALLPGLVNAHAHLELGSLGGPAPRTDFVAWVGDVLAQLATREDAAFDEDLERNAARLLATGTTTVGDVASRPVGRDRLASSPLRVRVYHEFLDAHDPERTARELARLEALAPSGLAGLSPHAPHTVSGALLEAIAGRARELELPLCVHWAETPEEGRWMERGGGPFAAHLGESPARGGLEHLEAAGVLGLRVALVHANEVERAELERAARAGAVLVHCPGTHRYFGRPPLDWRAWVASDATIALGTDSLASNDDLDLRLEMARLREAHPALPAATVLEWATRGGARALGLEATIGDLGVGKAADLVALRVPGVADQRDLLEAVTAGRPEVAGTWRGGDRV